MLRMDVTGYTVHLYEYNDGAMAREQTALL